MAITFYAPDRYREPKIYTHTDLLFPYWGIATKDSSPYMKAAYLQHQYSKEDFRLVERIEDADYVLLPYQYDRFRAVNPQKVDEIIEEARRARKPIIIDGSGDIEKPISIPNSVVFRIGQYHYAIQPDELTLSYPVEDLLQSYMNSTLRLREKTERPSVGFAGWAKVPLKRRLKLWLKELPITLAEVVDSKRGAEHKGILFRARALASLAKNSRIEPHFTVRSTFSGNVNTIQGNQADNRREFVENLLGSDYALCVRGDANASMRFYEALSVGRIPLFLDTACVLPLEDKINYRDFCVFVDWKDIDRLGDILADFHASISPEQFIAMQKKCREVYEQYLRIDHFSAHLAEELQKQKTRFYTTK